MCCIKRNKRARRGRNIKDKRNRRGASDEEEADNSADPVADHLGAFTQTTNQKKSEDGEYDISCPSA